MSANSNYFMRTNPRNGQVTFQGVQTGKMTVHHKERDNIILKEEGSKYWSGRSMPQSYAPAQFRVVKIIEDMATEGYYIVEEITSFPVRSQA